MNATSQIFRPLLLTAILSFALTACGGGSGSSGESTNPDDPVSEAKAKHFLNQASFGPNKNSINKVAQQGLSSWLNDQMNMPSAYDANPTAGTHTHIGLMMQIAKDRGTCLVKKNGNCLDQTNPAAINNISPQNNHDQLSAWWEQALFAPDQLRQRMAFALSELVVVGNTADPLVERGDAIAFYYDILARNAFGNYRTLLDEASRSTAMGVYLSMQGNKKGNPATGSTPDENFAREIMQLFSIGLFKLNLDGTPQLDSNGDTIPTYTQQDIEQMARVMTGWSRQVDENGGHLFDPSDELNDFKANEFGYLNARDGFYAAYMECHIEHHDTDPKVVLGTYIPGGQDCIQDLNAALDILMAHQNIAPFVAKHLIRRFVTSNPTPAYVARVASVFNNNGQDEKGDLGATLKAVLLDNEAQNTAVANDSSFGRIMNPIEMAAKMYRTLQATVPTGYARVIDLFVNPTRAATVFNYYESDFIPSDSRFVSQKLHAPESQILTDVALVDFFNWFAKIAHTKEVREKVFKHPDHSEPGTVRGTGLFSDNTDDRYSNDVYIDLKPQLDLLYQGLNQDYDNMDDTTLRTQAIEAVIDNLNDILLNNRMSQQDRDAVKNYLTTMDYSDSNSREEWAINVIQHSVLLMVSTAQFATQQ